MTGAETSPSRAQPQSGTDADDAALRFTARRHHDATVVSVSGELDAANVASLARVLAQFLRVHGGLVVDLDALQFCSVAGLEFFIYFHRRCRGARCTWALIPGPSLRRLLQLSAVILPTAESLADAADLLDATHSRRRTLRVVT